MPLDHEKETSPSRDHFAHLVAQWSHFGPPLCPSPDDNTFIQEQITKLNPDQALVLGLTPEIMGCSWQANCQITAVDHSPAMIKALWPPKQGPIKADVLEASWCSIPLPSHSQDLIVGDGCYIAFSYPEGFNNLTQEICRLLKPSGRFAIRVFIRPDQPEALEHITQNFTQAKIGSVHALKLRLLAALHGKSGQGTRLDDVWQVWRSLPDLPQKLKNTQGWTQNELSGIENYKGLETRYYLPTKNELKAVLSPLLLEESAHQGQYEWADYCPTFVWAHHKTS